MKWSARWGEMRQVLGDRWEALAEADLAAPDRSALARRIAERYGVSVREAKRQVRDLFTTLEAAVSGTVAGRQGRRAVERTISAVAEFRTDVLAGAEELVRPGAGTSAGEPRPDPGTARGTDAGRLDREAERAAEAYAGGLAGEDDTRPER
jgi:hypothetical protein